MHIGTFQLTTEGIDDPLRALEELGGITIFRHHDSGHRVSVSRCESSEAATQAYCPKFPWLWLHFIFLRSADDARTQEALMRALRASFVVTFVGDGRYDRLYQHYDRR